MVVRLKVLSPLGVGPLVKVIGLVTFQLSYPAVLVRARLATIGRQYEEAAQDLLERSGYRIVDTNVQIGAKSGQPVRAWSLFA